MKKEIVNNEQWKTVISAKRKFFNLQLGEVWAYKDLIMLFVKREFISKYKQTILGPLWAIIQPLLTTVVFSIVFGALAQLTTSDVAGQALEVPSFLFYMTGTIIWTYFSSTVTATSNTFIGNMAVMGKVYYPRLVTPISTALSDLISFFIQLVLFLVILVICILSGSAQVSFTWYVALLPICILQMILLSTAIGVIISALTTKYRDLAMLVGFGLQLWQYASPVAYGLSLIPEEYYFVYSLNPVTPIITTFRCGVFGTGYFDLVTYLIGVGVTVFLFLLGVLLFNKIEKNFMDTI